MGHVWRLAYEHGQVVFNGFIAIATLVVITLQTIASHAQAKAAKAQVAASESSQTVSEELLKATKEAASAERRHGDLVRYQILESLRPMIAFIGRIEGMDRRLQFQNQGSGAALRFSVRVSNRSVGAGAIQIPQFVGPGSYDQLRITETASGYSIALRYHSIDGREFETKGAVKDGVITVQTVAEIGPNGEDKFICAIGE
jgi:hypothetical protein